MVTRSILLVGEDSKPKGMGGWDIKNLHWFSTTLSMKSMWHGLFGNALWSEVLHVKYIKSNILNWIISPIKSVRNVCNLQCGFVKAFSWIRRGLSWKVGMGTNVLVGIDRAIGIGDNYIMSHFLLDYLV